MRRVKMKEVKCKECISWKNGICLHYQRARSSGKKRQCGFFITNAKQFKKGPSQLRRWLWPEQVDSMKLKRRELQTSMEQAKLSEAAKLPIPVLDGDRKITVNKDGGLIDRMFKKK